MHANQIYMTFFFFLFPAFSPIPFCLQLPADLTKMHLTDNPHPQVTHVPSSQSGCSIASDSGSSSLSDIYQVELHLFLSSLFPCSIIQHINHHMCLLKATAHVLVHREVKSKEGAVEVGSSTGFAEAFGRGGSDKRPLLWCHTIYTQFLFFQRKRSSNKVFLMVTRLGEKKHIKTKPHVFPSYDKARNKPEPRSFCRQV